MTTPSGLAPRKRSTHHITDLDPESSKRHRASTADSASLAVSELDISAEFDAFRHAIESKYILPIDQQIAALEAEIKDLQSRRTLDHLSGPLRSLFALRLGSTTKDAMYDRDARLSLVYQFGRAGMLSPYPSPAAHRPDQADEFQQIAARFKDCQELLSLWISADTDLEAVGSWCRAPDILDSARPYSTCTILLVVAAIDVMCEFACHPSKHPKEIALAPFTKGDLAAAVFTTPPWQALIDAHDINMVGRVIGCVECLAQIVTYDINIKLRVITLYDFYRPDASDEERQAVSIIRSFSLRLGRMFSDDRDGPPGETGGWQWNVRRVDLAHLDIPRHQAGPVAISILHKLCNGCDFGSQSVDPRDVETEDIDRMRKEQAGLIIDLLRLCLEGGEEMTSWLAIESEPLFSVQ